MKKFIIVLIAAFCSLSIPAQTQVINPNTNPDPQPQPVTFSYPDTITGIPLAVHYDVVTQEWTLEMSSEIRGIHRLIIINQQTALLITNDPGITRVMIIRQDEDTMIIQLIRE